MRPVALCALVLATACGAQQRANREGRFDLGEPGTGWRKVSASEADQALVPRRRVRHHLRRQQLR